MLLWLSVFDNYVITSNWALIVVVLRIKVGVLVGCIVRLVRHCIKGHAVEGSSVFIVSYSDTISISQDITGLHVIRSHWDLYLTDFSDGWDVVFVGHGSRDIVYIFIRCKCSVAL